MSLSVIQSDMIPCHLNQGGVPVRRRGWRCTAGRCESGIKTRIRQPFLEGRWKNLIRWFTRSDSAPHDRVSHWPPRAISAHKDNRFKSHVYSQCPVSAIRLATLSLAEVSRPSQQSALETTRGGKGALPFPFLAFLEWVSS